VGQRRVVQVAPTGAGHLPSGPAQGVERAPVVGPGEQEVDVLHGAQPGLGVAGGHGRPLEHDRFEPGPGQRADRQCDGTGKEQ